MNVGKYIVVSGFYHRPGASAWASWFHHLWFRNLYTHADPFPEKVIILASDRCSVEHGRGNWLHLNGDLGNTDAVLYGKKPWFMAACACGWMAGAWLGYLAQADVVFLEQDVLAFGPWVSGLYEQLGKRQAIFGHSRMHGVATSLFLVRHAFLPQFVHDYLSEGRENNINRIPEAKVLRMTQRSPEHYCQYSFGYDKDRPFNPHDPVWFAQKFTRHELLRLESMGLISCEWMPSAELFSNNP